MKMSTKLPELVKLLDLPDAPKDLYFQGIWQAEIFADCVAVVGSRKMTHYGRQVLEKLIPSLVFAKKTIVSGFMYGVDQYAHHLALENGGRTIAVLGWGITEKLTGLDKKLADRILEGGGLLLSEWENRKGALWTFPKRNRIITALSKEVYIIEADIKSGSLITADLAVRLKRKLWAVPGPITSRTSRGTNELIKTGLAEAWLGPEILPPDSRVNDPLINLLTNEELTPSEIGRKLNLPIEEIGAKLSILSLTGNVKERGGKYSC